MENIKYLADLGSSPLSRGIHVVRTRRESIEGIIPALAGNTRSTPPQPSCRGDHPRSRGEYTHPDYLRPAVVGSSPLSRGIPWRRTRRSKPRRIIPALAGNTGTKAAAGMLVGDHPRSRGEYLTVYPDENGAYGSSPLSRGIPEGGALHRGEGGIIPALAGNTAPAAASLSSTTDHPRSRGEYLDRLTKRNGNAGSSPLSRGIRAVITEQVLAIRIIPALAGNTGCWAGSRSWCWDHPRSRGEYGISSRSGLSSKGSSPLSRGIPSIPRVTILPARIIPALAGNTPYFGPYVVTFEDHPRSRGEYTFRGNTVRIHPGSSPLSRGIPHAFSVLSSLEMDHPRSRGEYSFRVRVGDDSGGSSPLSRGIRFYY